MSSILPEDKFRYLLRLGDNALILGQRLSHWCGKGPALEEDMALANAALDLFGQARLWYSYAGEIEGAGRNENDLAFTRDAQDFANLLLVEQPNGNYADTMVRQFFFDTWHSLLLHDLATSSDEQIAGIAEKAVKEVGYHVRRSEDLIVRMGDGIPESKQKVQIAVDRLWMFTGEMFDADEIDEVMEARSVSSAPSTLRRAWLANAIDVMREATLLVPQLDAWMQRGGKQGRHTENLGYVLAEMQFLQRAYPGAQW